MIECALESMGRSRKNGFWRWFKVGRDSRQGLISGGILNTCYDDSSSEDECPYAPKKARMGGPSA